MNAVGKRPKAEGPGQGVLAADKGLGRWGVGRDDYLCFLVFRGDGGGWTYGSQPFLSYLP